MPGGSLLLFSVVRGALLALCLRLASSTLVIVDASTSIAELKFGIDTLMLLSYGFEPRGAKTMAVFVAVVVL